jgi:hypothetical protein
MEYRRAYRDEQPDGYLVDRHEREIFPLMKRRALFSGSGEFRLYDLYTEGGSVNENVFAYSNRANIGGHDERALIFYNNSYYETAGWIKASDPAIPVGDGRKRRDNLSEALALHGGDKWFTLFRDQHSDLWYIRSSKAICENGFFVALKGYESQVFIDIYEIEDDGRGRWARLHHDLQGRGVSNPHTAIMDIYLGDLYYRFMRILKPEIVSQLQGFFVKGKASKQQTETFIESIKVKVEEYFATVKYFIGGADGKFDPWTGNSEQGTDSKEQTMSDAELWNEFKGYVERVIGLVAYLDAPGKSPEETLLKELAGQLRKRQLVCAAALGYGLLSVLRAIIGKGASGSLAENLAFEHWGLDRKLREQYRIFGEADATAASGAISGTIDHGAIEGETWQLGEISRIVLSRTAPEEQEIDAASKDAAQKNEAGLFAAAIIEDNYLYDDFRRLIGVNIFDDVTWFNKEAFERTLAYGKLFLVLEGDSAYPGNMPWLQRVARIAEITGAIQTAEAASGYRLDSLMQLLSGEKPAATKAATTTAKKTTAKRKKKE